MRLFLHIFRELSSGFVFTVGGMLVLTLPAIAVAAVHKLSGIDTQAVLFYVPLVVAGLVPYIVPLAFLLATVATFGRLAADNEWVAVRMSGRHPLAVLVPAGVLACLLAGATQWLLSEYLPEIRRKETRYRVEATSAMFRNLSPGRTDIKIGAFYLDAQRRDGPDFINAFVHVPARGKETARSLVADRVHFQFDETSLYVVLANARTVIGDQDIKIGAPILRFSIDDLQADDERAWTSTRYKSSSRIQTELLDPATKPERAETLVYELNYRRALASTLIVFLFLGASTGLLLRRGTQLFALAVAVGYALVFYLLQMRLSKLLASSHVLPPVLCAWFVPALGLLAGLWLARRALWR